MTPQRGIHAPRFAEAERFLLGKVPEGRYLLIAGMVLFFLRFGLLGLLVAVAVRNLMFWSPIGRLIKVHSCPLLTTRRSPARSGKRRRGFA